MFKFNLKGVQGLQVYFKYKGSIIIIPGGFHLKVVIFQDALEPLLLLLQLITFPSMVVLWRLVCLIEGLNSATSINGS